MDHTQLIRSNLRTHFASSAKQMRKLDAATRREGMEFLIFAREWLRLGCFKHASIALLNARTVFGPLWKVERFKSSSK